MLDLLATKGTWGKGMLNPLQELLPEFNSFLDAQEEYLIKPVIQNAPEKRCEIISP